MKMKIYWLAEYTFEGDPDMKCLDGPFPSWDRAYEAQIQRNDIASRSGLIVEQTVEVE